MKKRKLKLEKRLKTGKIMKKETQKTSNKMTMTRFKVIVTDPLVIGFLGVAAARREPSNTQHPVERLHRSRRFLGGTEFHHFNPFQQLMFGEILQIQRIQRTIGQKNA